MGESGLEALAGEDVARSPARRAAVRSCERGAVIAGQSARGCPQRGCGVGDRGADLDRK